MTPIVVALVGATAGLGLALVLAALAGRPLLQLATAGASARFGIAVDRLALRLSIAVLAGLIVLQLTGWPVAAVTAAAVGAWLPSRRATRGRPRHEIEVVDAVATWTEQLRDTISAANGLEHAIVATSTLAPRALAPAVARLASRVELQQMDVGLRDFAAEVDQPLADFVAAALVTANRHQARDIAALLGHLSSCARDEAAMRRRVWVGRARSRSAVRIIVGVVVVFMASLLMLDEQYLAPYGSPMGQLVLTGVIALFGGSMIAMERMGRIAMPERFIARRTEQTR